MNPQCAAMLQGPVAQPADADDTRPGGSLHTMPRRPGKHRDAATEQRCGVFRRGAVGDGEGQARANPDVRGETTSRPRQVGCAFAQRLCRAAER
jgi:hypothetical protein